MTRALLLPDGWDVKLHQVLVDLYLEAKGHPILKFVTIMNTIRLTDTDKLIFPAPPDPCRQYANRRLQYFIRKGRRPSVPDDALVHLLSAITLDESISLLMNRREALRQGSHIDSDNGTDDDDSDDNDDAELSFTNANNDQAVNEISTALVNLSTSRSSRSMTGTAHVLIESVRQHLNPHGIIFLTGGTNIAPADHGLVSYRYAQIIVQLHHPMDRLNLGLRFINPTTLQYTYGAISHSFSSGEELSNVQSAIESSIEEQNGGNTEFKSRYDERVDRMLVILGTEDNKDHVVGKSGNVLLKLPHEVVANVGSNRRPSLSIPMTGSNITWQSELHPNRNGELHRHYGYIKRSLIIDDAGTEDTSYDFYAAWIFPIGEGVRTTTEQKKTPTKRTQKEIQDAHKARVAARKSPPRGGGN